MIDILKNRADRFSVLEKVYEAADGFTKKYIPPDDVTGHFDWDKDKSKRILRYLYDEKLVELHGFEQTITITSKGIKEIEKAKTSPDQPTQYFAPINVTHVEGDIINSQIQQATSNSSQTLKVKTLRQEAILKTLLEIKETITSFQLNEDVQNDLAIEIETVVLQCKRSEPRRNVVKGSLESIHSIMQGTVEKAGATLLAPRILQWINQLSEYIQNLNS